MKSPETIEQINKINHLLDHDANIQDIVKEFTNIITPKTGVKTKEITQINPNPKNGTTIHVMK